MRYLSKRITKTFFCNKTIYFHIFLGLQQSSLNHSPLFFCFSLLQSNFVYLKLVNVVKPIFLNFYFFQNKFLMAFFNQSVLYSKFIEITLFLNFLSRSNKNLAQIDYIKNYKLLDHVQNFRKIFTEM